MTPIRNHTWFVKTAQLLDAYEEFLSRKRSECEARGYSAEENLEVQDVVRECDRLREDFLRMENEIREWRKAHETR